MSDQIKIFSLTGHESHKVKIPLGQGSFSIGSIGMDKKKYDVLVDDTLAINWNAFDVFRTGAGGHWPRFFYYYGDDMGFVQWSEKRQIETFRWYPNKSVTLDLTKADIQQFLITVKADQKVKVILGEKILRLTLSGNIENVELETVGKACPMLSLYPDLPKEAKIPYILPVLGNLKKIVYLDLDGDVLGQPIDCKSLLQFTTLKFLNLSGNLTNLDSLKKLKDLQSLGLRYVPDLAGFPQPNCWVNLKRFIGWNIEETEGKRLKAELKKLIAEREMDYSSVSQLRKKSWFITEYGMPFSAWSDKNAKQAIKAYKAALKVIAKAKQKEEVKAAIEEFVKTINLLSGIETSEREDAATAVSQLVQTSSLSIDEDEAMDWFDMIRDF